MKNTLTYYYSACVGINIEGLSVLCDPWFSDGAYYGSWYQYPKFSNPIKTIPEYTYIFLSHLHEDHFDKKFLKDYLAKWPNSRIIIAKRKYDYLSKILRFNDLPFTIIDSISLEDVELNIIPYKDNEKEEIDSVLEIISKKSNRRLINLNDVPFDLEFHKSLAKRPFKLNCMLGGYSGAGPYPQTYFDTNDPLIKIKAEEKEDKFLKRFLKLCDIYKAKCNIPFAGKYFLGGKLSYLNKYRGVPDPLTLKKYRSDIIVPADGGLGVVNLDTSTCENERKNFYDFKKILDYLNKFENNKYHYEKNNVKNENYLKEMPNMLDIAFENAVKSFEKANEIACLYDFYFEEINHKVLLGSKNDKEFSIWKIYINSYLMYGILKGIYHWDTAEIGSHIKVRREPDVYSRKAHKILCFLRV